MNLSQQIVAWGRIALNWLKHFFKLIWGIIVSYWPKIKALVKDMLKDATEVVILDGREKGGQDIINALRNSRPKDVNVGDILGLISLAVNKDGNISKVSELEASPQQEDQYDQMMHQNNGIIRING